MKRISLLVLGLLLAVNSGSCWRRRRSRPPPPPPIHGGWSGWGPFEVCTEKCGGGTQTQYRQCNNPRPGNGGSSCSGSYTNTINCNTHPCPVHGGWTAWDEYGSCGKSCGGGTQYRRRTCTNPSPAHEGEDCLGASVETRSCNTQPCPVHGAWSEWGEYGDCSRLCGGGNHSRSRQCTNPSPAHGGLNCSGVSSESKSCNIQHCLLCYRSWMSCAGRALLTAVVVMQHISVLTICLNTVSSILFISSQF